MTETTQAAPLVGHTAGPWHYQDHADVYTHIVRGPGNRFICQLTQDRSGVAEANARLIASAPEMAAELACLREERDAAWNVAINASARVACEGCRLAGFETVGPDWRHKEPMPIRCEAVGIKALRRANGAYTETRDNIAASRETQLAEAVALNAEMLAALQLILPMAKGYAHANRVGSNAEYIADAEAVVSRAEGRQS